MSAPANHGQERRKRPRFSRWVEGLIERLYVDYSLSMKRIAALVETEFGLSASGYKIGRVLDERGVPHRQGGRLSRSERSVACHRLARELGPVTRLPGLSTSAGGCCGMFRRCPFGEAGVPGVGASPRDFQMRPSPVPESLFFDTQAGPLTVPSSFRLRVMRRRGRSWNTYPIQTEDPRWLTASAVRKGDYLLVPRIGTKTNQQVVDLRPFVREGTDSLGRRTFGNRALDHVAVTENFAEYVGLYLAEGDTGGGTSVRYSLGCHEVDLAERAVALVDGIGYSGSWSAPSERSFLRVGAGGPVLARWLEKHCSSGAHSKRIPELFLTHANPEVRAGLLRGYRLGDGSAGKASGTDRDLHVVSSVSPRLIQDVVLLLAQDGLGGHYASQQYAARWIGEHWTEARTHLRNFRWNPRGPSITFRALNGQSVGSWSHSYRIRDDGTWYPVKEVRASNISPRQHIRVFPGGQTTVNSFLCQGSTPVARCGTEC